MSYLFDNFFSLTLTGLTLGAVYGLVALGYTLVYGVLRLINFAHSEVFMYGTFAALWAVMLLGGRSGAGVGSVVLWVLAMLAAASTLQRAATSTFTRRPPRRPSCGRARRRPRRRPAAGRGRWR